METATIIMIYAWIGWLVIMIPTLLLLSLTAWLIGKAASKIASSLVDIYKLESIRYYFKKMEKQGTHAFKVKPDKET